MPTYVKDSLNFLFQKLFANQKEKNFHVVKCGLNSMYMKSCSRTQHFQIVQIALSHRSKAIINRRARDGDLYLTYKLASASVSLIKYLISTSRKCKKWGCFVLYSARLAELGWIVFYNYFILLILKMVLYSIYHYQELRFHKITQFMLCTSCIS